MMPSDPDGGQPGSWMTPAAPASSGEYADPPTDPLVPDGDGVHTYRSLIPDDVPFDHTWYYLFLIRAGKAAADDPLVPKLADIWDTRVRPAVRIAKAVVKNILDRKERETKKAAEHNKASVEAPLKALLAEKAASDKAFDAMERKAFEALCKARSELFDSKNENWIDARLTQNALAGKLGYRLEKADPKWKPFAMAAITAPIGIMSGLSLGSLGAMVDFGNLSAAKLPNLAIVLGGGLAVTFAAGWFIRLKFSVAAESRILRTRREHVTSLVLGFAAVAGLVIADAVIVSHGLLRPSEVSDALFRASGQAAPGSSSSRVPMYVASTFFMAAFAGLKAIQGWTAERAAVGNAIAFAKESAHHLETSPAVRSAERAIEGLAYERQRSEKDFQSRYDAILSRALSTDERLSEQDKREISYAINQVRGAMMEFDALWVAVFRIRRSKSPKPVRRTTIPSLRGDRWKAS